MNRPLIYILIFLLFNSCKKEGPLFDGGCADDCYVLQGKLIEQQTGNGLSDVELGIYYRHSPSSFSSKKTDWLGKIITKADGTYSFSFPRRTYRGLGGNVVITGVKDRYMHDMIYDENDLAIFKLGVDDDTIVHNLNLWKASLLKVRVVTTTTTNFNLFYFSHDFFGTSGSINKSIMGNRNFDTTYFIQTASDIKTYINWRTEQGITLSGRDSIVVPFDSTGSILIQL